MRTLLIAAGGVFAGVVVLIWVSGVRKAQAATTGVSGYGSGVGSSGYGSGVGSSGYGSGSGLSPLALIPPVLPVVGGSSDEAKRAAAATVISGTMQGVRVAVVPTAVRAQTVNALVKAAGAARVGSLFGRN